MDGCKTVSTVLELEWRLDTSHQPITEEEQAKVTYVQYRYRYIYRL